MFIIKVKSLTKDARIPTYGSEQALGADLYSVEAMDILSGYTGVVSHGIAIEPNMFCDIQVRPRSGLAAKHGVTVLNAPGTIDPDYRGEIKTILINLGRDVFHVEKGMRVSQLVALHPYEQVLHRARFEVSDELSYTSRGIRGFGSTGQGGAA